jgi:hypothetical protein
MPGGKNPSIKELVKVVNPKRIVLHNLNETY